MSTPPNRAPSAVEKLNGYAASLKRTTGNLNVPTLGGVFYDPRQDRVVLESRRYPNGDLIYRGLPRIEIPLDPEPHVSQAIGALVARVGLSGPAEVHAILPYGPIPGQSHAHTSKTELMVPALCVVGPDEPEPLNPGYEWHPMGPEQVSVGSNSEVYGAPPTSLSTAARGDQHIINLAQEQVPQIASTTYEHADSRKYTLTSMNRLYRVILM